jgi:hypothetical protein
MYSPPSDRRSTAPVSLTSGALTPGLHGGPRGCRRGCSPVREHFLERAQAFTNGCFAVDFSVACLEGGRLMTNWLGPAPQSFDPSAYDFEKGVSDGIITFRRTEQSPGHNNTGGTFFTTSPSGNSNLSREYKILKNGSDTGFVLHTHANGSQIECITIKTSSLGAQLRKFDMHQLQNLSRLVQALEDIRW